MSVLCISCHFEVVGKNAFIMKGRVVGQAIFDTCDNLWDTGNNSNMPMNNETLVPLILEVFTKLQQAAGNTLKHEDLK